MKTALDGIFTTTRVEAFSEGVLAIVITLLIFVPVFYALPAGGRAAPPGDGSPQGVA